MAVINMSSIIPKIKAYTETSSGKKQVSQAIQKVIFSVNTKSMKHTPEEIAAKFVSTMQDAVRSTQGAGARGGALGESAVAAALGFAAGTAVTSEMGGTTIITIPFNFEGNLHRDSLYSSQYSGVDNIVALLNNGYSAKSTVFGMWHGNKIRSLQERSGAGFIQNAVRQFWDRYASEYNIINIEIDGVYK